MQHPGEYEYIKGFSIRDHAAAHSRPARTAQSAEPLGTAVFHSHSKFRRHFSRTLRLRNGRQPRPRRRRPHAALRSRRPRAAYTRSAPSWWCHASAWRPPASLLAPAGAAAAASAAFSAEAAPNVGCGSDASAHTRARPPHPGADQAVRRRKCSSDSGSKSVRLVQRRGRLPGSLRPPSRRAPPSFRPM